MVAGTCIPVLLIPECKVGTELWMTFVILYVPFTCSCLFDKNSLKSLLKTAGMQGGENLVLYVIKVIHLGKKFQGKFSYIQSHEVEHRLFSTPFSVPVANALRNYNWNVLILTVTICWKINFPRFWFMNFTNIWKKTFWQSNPLHLGCFRMHQGYFPCSQAQMCANISSLWWISTNKNCNQDSVICTWKPSWKWHWHSH